MKTQHVLTASLVAGAALALSGCGGSYDDSRDVYEELRVEIGCDTVDSDDFESFMEGEVADGFPAFDAVSGYCQQGDEEFSVLAVVPPHDVNGEEFLEALSQEDSGEGFAVQSRKWVVVIDGDDEEDRQFADTVKDELGGKVVAFSENGGQEGLIKKVRGGVRRPGRTGSLTLDSGYAARQPPRQFMTGVEAGMLFGGLCAGRLRIGRAGQGQAGVHDR